MKTPSKTRRLRNASKASGAGWSVLIGRTAQRTRMQGAGPRLLGNTKTPTTRMASPRLKSSPNRSKATIALRSTILAFAAADKPEHPNRRPLVVPSRRQPRVRSRAVPLNRRRQPRTRKLKTWNGSHAALVLRSPSVTYRRQMREPPPLLPAKQSRSLRAAGPSITVETIGPHKISVGKQATYKLVLRNTGAIAANDVIVTAVVPDFAEVVDARGTGGTTEPSANREGLTWKLGTLAAQGREELSLDIVPRKSQPFELAVRWSQAPVASQTTVEVQEPKLGSRLTAHRTLRLGTARFTSCSSRIPATGMPRTSSLR